MHLHAYYLLQKIHYVACLCSFRTNIQYVRRSYSKCVEKYLTYELTLGVENTSSIVFAGSTLEIYYVSFYQRRKTKNNTT